MPEEADANLIRTGVLVPQVKSPTREQFGAYVEALPASLVCWREGDLGTYPMLAWLNTHPVVVQRQRTATDGPLLATWATTRVHHNQVGVGVAWTARYMAGRRAQPSTRERDRVQLFGLARRYWLIRNLLAEVYQGVRGYEAKGSRIVLTFSGDKRLDALDRLLDLVDDMDSTQVGADWESRMQRWLLQGGRDTPWEGVPAWARDQYQRFAARLIQHYPNYLAPELDVGGFTIGEATRVLTELLARASHMHICTYLGCTKAEVVVPPVQTGDLVNDVSNSVEVDPDRVRRVIELLTMDLRRCPDPCLTPLIPLGGNVLVPMSSLIFPSSPVRNLTALLQHDHATFGKAGKALGALGARTVAETLRHRLSGARVTTGVKVFRRNGQQAGDLDVVACDAAERRLAVFEVMWRIGPDGSAEVAKSEEDAHVKRAQVKRLRGEIATGEGLPRWPANWPDVEGFDARWFILTPNVLPVREVASDQITVRSHQMLERMLFGQSTVADLVKLLEEPPYPPPEICQTQWEKVRYGAYTVEFDVSMA